MYFITFGIIPCICWKLVFTANGNIDIKKMIKIILVIYAITGIFLLNKNFWELSPERRMSVTYYILPLFIAIILDIFFFDKGKKLTQRLKKYILYIVIFYVYLNFYLIFASRGAYVAIFVCLLLCFITMIKSRLKKILFTIIGFSIIIILAISMRNILVEFNSILNNMNIHSRTIERTIELYEEENLGNGRDKVYEDALDGIQEKMIFGNGIGNFERKYQTYPHNIILQTWYEGGIINMIIILIPIIYSIYLITLSNKINDNNKYLLIFFFSISLVRLMLSYEYWKDNYFWVYIYITLVFWIGDEKYKNGNSNNTNI